MQSSSDFTTHFHFGFYLKYDFSLDRKLINHPGDRNDVVVNIQPGGKVSLGSGEDHVVALLHVQLHQVVLGPLGYCIQFVLYTITGWWKELLTDADI